jgi:hypothetical protein
MNMKRRHLNLALFILCAAVPCIASAGETTVLLTADFTQTRHVLRGAIGASWHAMETPIPVVVGCRNNLIEGNHVHHVAQRLADTGGIYTLGDQPGGVLRGNYIHDITRFSGVALVNGIFFDKGDGGSRRRVDTINAALKAFADGQQVRLVEISERLLKPDRELELSYYVADKLHLSADGYRVWAEAMDPVLDALLK